MKHILCKTTTSSVSFQNLSDDQIQPNAIDLKVKAISRLQPGTVVLNGKEKRHLPSTVVEPENGLYHLSSGKYDVVFDGEVTIGDNEAGFLITRSTLNRNGIIITSGLYDSGYNNIIGGMLHIPEGTHLAIGEHERLAQFLLFDAEMIHRYDGDYNRVTTEE